MIQNPFVEIVFSADGGAVVVQVWIVDRLKGRELEDHTGAGLSRSVSWHLIVLAQFSQSLQLASLASHFSWHLIVLAHFSQSLQLASLASRFS